MVVATDFSASSEYALKRVSLLPLHPHATVWLVHSLPAQLPAALASRVRKGSEDTLEEQRERLSGLLREKHGEGVRLSVHIQQGEPSSSIVGAAKELGASLIVVGRHGRDTLKTRWLGSTAERVTRAGVCSVLVVQSRPRTTYARPLVAIDAGPTTESTLHAVSLLVPTRHKGAIPVLHCQPVPYESFVRAIMTRDEIKEYLSDLGQEAKGEIQRVLGSLNDVPTDRFALHVQVGDPRECIPKEIDSRKSDVLIVGTRARGTAAHALLGSVAETLVRQATCDVLVARPTA